MRSVMSLVAAALLTRAGLAAQTSGAFVTRLGADTVAVEQYVRSGNTIRGELVVRTPSVVHRLFTIVVGPEGAVQSFELVTHNVQATTGPFETRATAEFRGDTAVVTAPRRDSTVTLRVPGAAGGAPFVVHLYALFELYAQRARAADRDTLHFPAVGLGAPQPFAGQVRRLGRDSFSIRIGQLGPLTAKLDAGGRMAQLSGKGSTLQVDVRRVTSLDMAGLGKAFAVRPALGLLSPRDTASATIGDGELLIDYGRPLKRGRVVFGNVVPWNQVWRTGANAATVLQTSEDLVVGGATVPIGTYTLWTLPAPTGWKLIISRKTKNAQGNPLWGTEYTDDQDVARVDLKVEKLAEPVEQFTIVIEPAGAGATLTMSWDDTQVSIPVARK